MGVTFLIEISNAPAKLIEGAAFKRAFESGIERLLFNYHVDNDREGSRVEWFVSEGGKGESIEMCFYKEDGQVVFDDLEKKLMSEIMFLLEEVINELGDDKFEAGELI